MNFIKILSFIFKCFSFSPDLIAGLVQFCCYWRIEIRRK